MRVVAVGNIDRTMIKGMTGKRGILIVADTDEEVRSASTFLYGEPVAIVTKGAAPLLDTREEDGNG